MAQNYPIPIGSWRLTIENGNHTLIYTLHKQSGDILEYVDRREFAPTQGQELYDWLSMHLTSNQRHQAIQAIRHIVRDTLSRRFSLN